MAETINLDSDTRAYLSRNYIIRDSIAELCNIISSGESGHAITLFSQSGQGKTTLLRKIIRHICNNTNIAVIYAKNTREFDDSNIMDLVKGGRLIFTKYDLKLSKTIRTLTKRYAQFIQDVLDGKKSREYLPNIMIIFDDVQGLSPDLTTQFNKDIRLLSRQGRHSGISFILSAQSWRSIEKSSRGNQTLFITLLPINDEYIEEIYNFYFASVPKTKNRELFSSLTLPRFTVMVKRARDNKKWIFINKN